MNAVRAGVASLGVGLAVGSVAGCYCSHLRDDDAGRDAPVTFDTGLDTSRIGFPPDVPMDAPPFDAGPTCHLPAPTAALSGMTPIGGVDLPYGYAGRGNITKACFGVALYWTDVDSTFAFMQPDRELFVWLPRESAEPILGIHRNVLATYVDRTGMLTSNAAVVEVTAFTRDEVDPAVTATIRIVDIGWDITGTISAPYCLTFSDPCI